MIRKLMGLAAIGAVAAPIVLGIPGLATGSERASVTLEGHVRDAETGTAVGGAQVFIVGTVMGTLTDASGFYRLVAKDDAMVGSSVTVTVRLIGFAETSRQVAIETSGTTTVDFAVEQTALRLQDIVVTDVEEDSPQTKLPFTVERLEPAQVGVAGKVANAFRALGAAPAALAIAPSGLRGRYNGAFNTESYALIDENRWQDPSEAPLSTFSIDVDRASYSNVRRFIQSGERPPIDAVRIEEMINYFAYDYPETDREHPFTISTEVAIAPWNERHRLVRIGVQGERVDLEDLPPSNFVFLLDVSGSMQPANKLPLLKKSLRLLVNELRPEDRVAIVVYAGAAGLVLPSTSGRHKARIRDAIESLEAGGSTAGGAGIRLAYETASENFIVGGNNRVILATDGDFNIGASSDAEMTRLIERKRERGTFLTVLGFGDGNLKDSKMEALADHGNGNYAYIDNLLEARKVLVSEMGGTLLTIAKDVKIQVEFNPARVQAYRLIGYENRLLAAEDFNDDAKDAGELGAGHTVTALYQVAPIGALPVGTGSVDPLRYGRSESGVDETAAGLSFGPASEELLFVKLRYKQPDGDRSRLIQRPVEDRVTRASENLRFAASVAAFGMRLRDSEHCADFSLDEIARLAESAVGDDRHGYRSEFVRLVRATEDLDLLGESER